MKGECGIHTISAVEDIPFDQVKSMFQEQFGKTHLLGSDMRKLLIGSGWRWTSKYAMSREEIPSNGKVVVVTRRGFYAVINGEPYRPFSATICGYYEEPAK